MAYATIVEGDIYFSMRLNSEVWEDANTADKQKALEQGTIIIDRLNFAGCKTDENQSEQFPRGEDTVVPEDIKSADCEIALALLDGVDPEIESENLRMTAHKYGSVQTNYDVGSPPLNVIAGVPSMSAWRYLVPYLRDQRAITLHRV
jgi:hypothetical protein